MINLESYKKQQKLKPFVNGELKEEFVEFELYPSLRVLISAAYEGDVCELQTDASRSDSSSIVFLSNTPIIFESFAKLAIECFFPIIVSSAY